MEIEILKKEINEYRQEWEKISANREKLLQMLNQQERKMEQLSGAILALERIVMENEKEAKEEVTDEQLKNNTDPAEG